MSRPSHVSVLKNPRSGQGKAVAKADRAIDRLRERGIDVRVLEGVSAEESLALARDAVAGGTEALVAAGGDGLINGVLQAVAGTAVPFGIVPGGTGNDLAREFGIPTDDPVAAADIIAEGNARTIDLGKAGDRWFATVVASGFDSKVTDRANAMRWPRGPMRYNLAILAELAQLKPIAYRIELDDRVVEVDAVLCAVGNTRSYGGGMLMCPGARTDDGLLDVTVVRGESRLRLIRLMPTVYKGTHIELDEVDTYRSRSVRLVASGINADADGEVFGPLPITITNVPGAGRILAPDSAQSI